MKAARGCRRRASRSASTGRSSAPRATTSASSPSCTLARPRRRAALARAASRAFLSFRFLQRPSRAFLRPSAPQLPSVKALALPRTLAEPAAGDARTAASPWNGDLDAGNKTDRMCLSILLAS
eukprot:scaffold7092_cov262-Pinguiococcus_pyrenoidosus.AAC.10